MSGWDAIGNPVPGNPLLALEELGVTDLRQLGDEINGKCPAHLQRTGKEDKHPSWSVNAESGVHNCFSCGFKGPFVSLVEYLLDLDRGEAATWVRQRGGIERAKKILGTGMYIHEIPAGQNTDTTKNINEASLALYTPPPEEALEKRGIDAGSAEHYGILWDPAKELWITPIRDPDDGTLWGWQAKNERYFRNRPRDVQKSHTLFGLDQFAGDVAVLVESPLDVPYLHTNDVDGVLATFGSGISHEQMTLVLSVADIVVSAMDNDKAGREANQWLLKNYASRTRLRFWNYGDSDAKDPGDMLYDEIHQALGTSFSSVVARSRFR